MLEKQQENLTQLIKDFPTTFTIQRKSDGKFLGVCPGFQTGLIDGVETPEEVLVELKKQFENNFKVFKKVKKKI